MRERRRADEAKRLLHKYRIEKLLVVDEDYRCVGLITVKDIEKAERFPNACKDEQGRLRVGAATGVGDEGLERAEVLLDAERRCHRRRYRARPFAAASSTPSRGIKRRSNYAQVIAGNIATADGARGTDRCRRRRRQGRHRPGIDLHDAHRRRRRRSAVLGDRRGGRGVPGAATCR